IVFCSRVHPNRTRRAVGCSFAFAAKLNCKKRVAPSFACDARRPPLPEQTRHRPTTPDRHHQPLPARRCAGAGGPPPAITIPASVIISSGVVIFLEAAGTALFVVVACPSTAQVSLAIHLAFRDDPCRTMTKLPQVTCHWRCSS